PIHGVGEEQAKRGRVDVVRRQGRLRQVSTVPRQIVVIRQNICGKEPSVFEQLELQLPSPAAPALDGLANKTEPQRKPSHGCPSWRTVCELRGEHGSVRFGSLARSGSPGGYPPGIHTDHKCALMRTKLALKTAEGN